MSPRVAKRHFFDGEPGVTPCAACGDPYESARFDHDFGKLVNPLSGVIRPYTAAGAVREEAELAAEDAAGAEMARRLADLRAFPIGSKVRHEGRAWTVADYLLDAWPPLLILTAVPPVEGPVRVSALPSTVTKV